MCGYLRGGGFSIVVGCTQNQTVTGSQFGLNDLPNVSEGIDESSSNAIQVSNWSLSDLTRRGVGFLLYMINSLRNL